MASFVRFLARDHQTNIADRAQFIGVAPRAVVHDFEFDFGC